MSLVAWYPLRGDTKDYSGNNNNLVNTGAVSISTGKIGTCYDFAQTSNQMLSTNEVHISRDITMAGWFNIASIDNDTMSGILNLHDHGDFSNLGLNVKKYDTQYKLTCNVGYIDNTREYNEKVGSTLMDYNKWYHLALTYDYDKKILNLYVNGVQDGSWTLPKQIKTLPKKIAVSKWSLSNSSYNITGKINDVRIYDNALSKYEIKQLSMAKVVHLNFNDQQESTVNLQSGFSFNTATKGSDYFVKTADDAWYTGLALNNTNVTAGKTYTWSFEVKSDTKFTYRFDANCTANNYTGNDAAMSSTIQQTGDYTNINRWTRVALTVTIQSDAESPRLHHAFCPDPIGNGLKVYIRRSQVEEKDHMTDYVSGTRNAIIRDISGYKNNATVATTTTPQWIEEGMMGSGSYKFNGSNSISLVNNFLKQDNLDQEWTVCAWVKSTNVDVAQTLVNLNSGCNITWGSTKKALLYLNGGSNDSYRYSDATLENNKWYHIAFVFKHATNTVQVFLNGVESAGSLVSPSGKTPSGIPSTLTIGGAFRGLISDFTIYTTALSSKDINDLYSNKITIDKSNNLYCNEIVEEKYNENLVINGDATDGTNYNFSDTTFIASDDTIKRPCFERYGALTLQSTEFIEVDHNCTYELSGLFKSMSTNLSKLHFGIACYDKDKSAIAIDWVNHTTNTRTTLAQQLANGDTVVKLTSVANWVVGTQGAEDHTKTMAIFNRPGFENYQLPSSCDRYLNVDTSANTITLKTAWNRGTIPAGTNVANTRSGSTFNYIAYAGGTVPNTWTKYSATISGGAIGNDTKFRYGTRYIKILFLMNYSQDSTYGTRFTDISFINKTKQQKLKTKMEFKANKKSIFDIGEVNELGVDTNYLYGYWPLDKSLKDYSGNKLHCTNYNAVQSGNGYQVSAGKYISTKITDMSTFVDNCKDFTLSAMVNIGEQVCTQGQGVVFGGMGYNWGIEATSFDTTNKTCNIRMEMWTSDNGTSNLNPKSCSVSSATIPLNTWVHVAGTCDIVTKKLKLYINGNLSGTADLQTKIWFSSKNLIFGSSNSGAYWCEATITDAKLFNRELTAGEIKNMANVSLNNLLLDKKGNAFGNNFIEC